MCAHSYSYDVDVIASRRNINIRSTQIVPATGYTYVFTGEGYLHDSNGQSTAAASREDVL